MKHKTIKLHEQKLDKWHDPEKTFLNLYAKKKFTFWLDQNNAVKSNNRYSYMGCVQDDGKRIKYTLSNYNLSISKAGKTKKLHKSIFDYLKEELKKWQNMQAKIPYDFIGGYIGYFGYELQAECGSKKFYKSPLPDAYFFFVEKLIVFDHQKKTVHLLYLGNEKQAKRWITRMQKEITKEPEQRATSIAKKPDSKKIIFAQEREKKQYLNDIRTCQKYLSKGDAYQICLTTKVNAKIETDWLKLYQTLRKINPAPYNAYINFGDFALLSSSPEQFLSVDQQGMVTAKPMKGTAKRGKNPKEDKQIAKKLGKTEKDYAENIMIVDLVRNDLGKVCEIGSVKVTKPLSVETYPTVHQLVSTISGKLRADMSIIDVVKAAFPAGSMTGAPKIRAMEIIASIEGKPRGIYSGAFGFLSINKSANLAMVIRTIIATNNELSLGSGGAILMQSDPQNEYLEMLLKTKALIRAIMKSQTRKNYKSSNTEKNSSKK